MTDKEAEIAARYYCKQKNINPDEIVASQLSGSDPLGIIAPSLKRQPAWVSIAAMLQEADLVARSLSYGQKYLADNDFGKVFGVETES